MCLCASAVVHGTIWQMVAGGREGIKQNSVRSGREYTAGSMGDEGDGTGDHRAITRAVPQRTVRLRMQRACDMIRGAWGCQVQGSR
ncbi:MAG: hypothetical protein AMXMBFR4_21480 [Candidatus Hydrogenedentota bacterium]